MKASTLVSIIFGCLSICSCNTTTLATYYLPVGFEGSFAVVYYINKGCPEVKIDGRRQFYIPKNGICVTRAAVPIGFADVIFMRRTSGGGYDTLKEFIPKTRENMPGKMYVSQTSDSTKFCVSGGSLIGYNYPGIKNYADYREGREGYHVEVFYVSKQHHSKEEEESIEKFSKNLNSLAVTGSFPIECIGRN